MPPTKDFTATIIGDSKRAQEFKTILGTDTVIIKSPFSILADLPGKPSTRIYEMDITALDDGQKQRLISHLAAKFNIPQAEVAKDIDKTGCPILADDVVVSIHNPQKWF